MLTNREIITEPVERTRSWKQIIRKSLETQQEKCPRVQTVMSRQVDQDISCPVEKTTKQGQLVMAASQEPKEN